MNAAWKPADELADLVEATCLGAATPEQFDRLMELVVSDQASRRYYVRYLHMHASLPRIFQAADGAVSVSGSEFHSERSEFHSERSDCHSERSDCHSERSEESRVGPAPEILRFAQNDTGENVERQNDEGHASDYAAESPAVPVAPPASLPFGFLSQSWQGTTAFLHEHEFFTGYMVATVLFGIATLIAANIYITHHQSAEYAENRSISPAPMLVKPDSKPEPKIVSIARIAGMVDCVWVDANYAPFHDRIVQGDKFMLKSGLMEITYKTGARVILQGPCTYEVDSTAGGFLSLGKLTARVESRSRLPDGTSRSRFPSGTLPTDRDASKSRPAGGTYFAVRTPTATVTDLGTEFGVEVGKEGNAHVVVFVGEVETALKNQNASDSKPVRLKAGHSAELGQAKIVVLPKQERPAANAGFVRKIAPRLRVPLLGFYPLAEDAKDHGGHGNHVEPSKMHGIEFIDGPDGRAARFREEAGSYIDLPIDASPESMPKLTWGAWVRPQKVGSTQCEILSTDNYDLEGYDRALTIDDRLGIDPVDGKQIPRTNVFHFSAFRGNYAGGGILFSDGPRPEVGRRMFVAAVYDQKRETIAIYVEDRKMNAGRGGLVANRSAPARIGSSNYFVRLGRHANGIEPFDGEIDNVFIFGAALGAVQLEAIRAGGAKAILAIARGEDAKEETRKTLGIGAEAESSYPSRPPVNGSPSIIVSQPRYDLNDFYRLREVIFCGNHQQIEGLSGELAIATPLTGPGSRNAPTITRLPIVETRAGQQANDARKEVQRQAIIVERGG